MRVGFSAPTTGMKGISQELEMLGYDNISAMTYAALLLHTYNGLYNGLTNYSTKEEAINDIINLINFILNHAKKYFRSIWNNDHEYEYTLAVKTFNEIKGKT
ncbi:PaREP1 family protein [Acidianus hospitalis]|uniref:PaREP1 family protein n=1 Tax=Acidianus hospitalis TaxID=563177 RepID=UPI00247998C5|nr:PaREP1 family protein [Acidianus hospitalis]